MKNIAVVLFAAALLLAGGIFLQAHNEMASEKKFMIAGNTAGCYSISTSSLNKENQIDNKNGIPVKKRKPNDRRPVKLSASAHEKRKATNLPYKLILQNALLTWQ